MTAATTVGEEVRPTWLHEHLVREHFNIWEAHHKGLWPFLRERLGNRKEWREGETSGWYLLGLWEVKAVSEPSLAGQREKAWRKKWALPVPHQVRWPESSPLQVKYCKTLSVSRMAISKYMDGWPYTGQNMHLIGLDFYLKISAL